jgi:divalent metal cation (Fe/Co/Zn/Cd) transporter
MDRQAEPDLLQAIRKGALGVPGVLGVEKLLVRKTGLEYLVDIHVEVDGAKTVREGHAIGHAVKDRLLQSIVTIKDVLVHIEPAPIIPAGQG